MVDDEDLDPRVIARIREFSEQGMDAFDLERTVTAATRAQRHSRLRTAAVVATAAVIVVVGAATAGSLLGPRLRATAGNSPLPASIWPTLEVSPLPSGAATPSGGLTMGQAIAAARASAPQSAELPVTVAKAGPAGELLDSPEGYHAAPGLPHDRWVWVVVLFDNSAPLSGRGSIVVIDFVNGAVYDVMNVIG